MDNLKQELEALKAIEDTVLPPHILPMPYVTENNKAIKVPTVVQEYLNKIGVKFKLNKNGEIRLGKYLKLLDRHNLLSDNTPRPTCYKTVTKKH